MCFFNNSQWKGKSYPKIAPPTYKNKDHPTLSSLLINNIFGLSKIP